jgi:hypothetical protein
MEERRHRLGVGDAVDRAGPRADDPLHVARLEQSAHAPAPDVRRHDEQRAERRQWHGEPRIPPDHLSREDGADGGEGERQEEESARRTSWHDPFKV